jgi:SAM-dependent methyltransferase
MVTGVHVIQGDIFHPPLARWTFDALYSIGVLHHTPDPPRAFQALVPCLAPGATAAIMLYASGRPVALGLLASIRALTLRLPLPVVKLASLAAAIADTVGPIALYRVLRKLGVPAHVLSRFIPEHVRLYADHTFDTCYTDWLDRLSYPYVHYYTGDDIAAWFGRGGLKTVSVRALGNYGWVGVGMVGGAPDLSSTATAGATGGR